MNISDILKTENNIQLVINSLDLKEFALYLIEQAKSNHGTEVSKKDTKERYMLTKEVMNLLKVTKTTLWRWKNEKYLIPVKVGCQNLYKQSDVERILNKDK